MDIEQLKSDVQQRMVGQPAILAVLLFGSHATGRAGPLSDVDIANLVDGRLDREAREKAQLAAIGELLDLMPGAELDVVLLNDAPPALSYRILRDGVVLLCRDRDAFVMFKAQALSMYFDFKPALDYLETRILERARRGELTHGPNPHRRAFEHHRRRRERPATDAGTVP